MTDQISLRQLRYFTALSRCRNFRKAAAECGVSQPSLSQQIKNLEERLGQSLVERSSSAVILTPLGREVAAAAVELLDRVRALEALADRGPLTGVLRLGVKPTLGPYLLPQVIRHLHKSYPDLGLVVQEALPLNLERELIEGGHDLALLQLPVSSPDLSTMRLFREPVFLAVAADHPLARKKTFGPPDLQGVDVLTLSPRHHLHDQVMRLCEESGARLRRDYEGTSLDALRQMAGMGLGATFLPALYVQSEIRRDADVRILKPARRPMFRSIALAWRKGAGLDAAVNAIAEGIMLAVKEAPDLIIER
ncbi:hydrogen peroxide-inducible genes activator protein [Parvularcula bermudensis HTCC2503]|uniref:Hydrogen peroxide-inducible genes activator protein n=1 Tax=Parvularcula bermudensis (strain ATCC BAA-594 / HTCC2503 / KCTC 12087) TaxID=314260 RepID=E0THE5_PARBH|nr:hydrogen peroxide-inducible genes activator [Parvularcula bermudensis]ADM10737.1 hydrogen peroxide-inducible genes activator protein [Parvularcula bermudensis HTCC2503]